MKSSNWTKTYSHKHISPNSQGAGVHITHTGIFIHRPHGRVYGRQWGGSARLSGHPNHYLSSLSAILIRNKLLPAIDLLANAAQSFSGLHWENYTSNFSHIINPLNIIVLWCTEDFSGALNWTPLMLRDASLSDSYKSDRWRFSVWLSFYTEKTMFPFFLSHN